MCGRVGGRGAIFPFRALKSWPGTEPFPPIVTHRALGHANPNLYLVLIGEELGAPLYLMSWKFFNSYFALTIRTIFNLAITSLHFFDTRFYDATNACMRYFSGGAF